MRAKIIKGIQWDYRATTSDAFVALMRIHKIDMAPTSKKSHLTSDEIVYLQTFSAIDLFNKATNNQKSK